MLGKALGTRRHDIVPATKFGTLAGPAPYFGGGSRRYVARAVGASL